MRYESVVGFGAAELIGDPQDGEEALACIMRQYGGPDESFEESALEKTLVIRVRIDEISGKARL
jgi:nitroimidazol reductase NimA-like FMN-containing flavoprotein (pyridoxamine 5'-phosphate oxidase superfamily)